MPLNQPSATELMDAIREHLDEQLRPKLSGKEAYDIRVASNLLSILKRELELGPGAAQRAQTRLTDLLNLQAGLDELNTTLSDRIRKREFDSSNEELLAHLRQTALDKLGIDNPRYSAYLRARPAQP
jgi:type IV secretory pathway VirB4 component